MERKKNINNRDFFCLGFVSVRVHHCIPKMLYIPWRTVAIPSISEATMKYFTVITFAPLKNFFRLFQLMKKASIKKSNGMRRILITA